MTPPLDDIAEDAAAYVRTRPGEVQEVADDAVLRHRPWLPKNSFYGHEASRLRLSDAPGNRIEEIRRWFRAQGFSQWMWVLGRSGPARSAPGHKETRGMARGSGSCESLDREVVAEQGCLLAGLHYRDHP